MEAVLILIVLGVVTYSVYKINKKKREEKQRRYDDAVSKMETGKNDEAIAVFTELGVFQNSFIYLRRAIRYKVEELIEEFNEAKVLFSNGEKYLLGANGLFEDNKIAEVELLGSCEITREKPERIARRCREAVEKASSILEDARKYAGQCGFSLEEQEKALVKMNDDLSAVTAFANSIAQIKISYMIADLQGLYGKPDAEFLASVKAMSEKRAQDVFRGFRSALDAKNLRAALLFDPVDLVRACWVYAMKKPFSADRYSSARETFEHLVRPRSGFQCFDMRMSEYYAKFGVAGEDAILDSVRKDIKEYKRTECGPLASFFMWIGARKAEAMVLDHMLSNGIEMSSKMQDRLHQLKAGGGKDLAFYDVKSSGSKLYFDSSSVEWNGKDVQSFFEGLSFREEKLGYSLAFREDEKTLVLPSGAAVPDLSGVYEKISSEMTEEYGNSVEVKIRNCVAISGNAEEPMKSIVARTCECDYMSVATLVIPVGKRLTIKQYTLYMPTNRSVEDQSKDACSLHGRLSSLVRVWEDGMRQSVLDAIERLLNEGIPSVASELESDDSSQRQEVVF